MSKIFNELSIVIPCKNDEITLINKIPELIKFCDEMINSYEIIIVINGSTEKNKKILESFITDRKFSNIKITSSTKIGKGAGIRKGLEISSYNEVLFSDADFSVSISYFTQFVNKDSQLLGDFVVGSRKLENSKISNTPITRIVTGYLYTLFVKVFLGLNISDTQCGFKAINKEKFKSYSEFQMNGFSFDVELFFLAKKEGVRIEEVAVDYIHDESSNVKILSDSLRMGLDLFTLFYRYRLKNLKI